jgi:hypothetical protein
MWVGLSLTAFAGALVLGATHPAGAEVVYIAPPASPTLTLRESVTPRRLSRSTPTPIALNLGGRIGTVDGSHPPAVKQIVLDLDRHIAIDLRGLPLCQGGRHDIRPPDLPSRCKDAIVGRGKAAFQIQFPEEPSIATESELVVFNGGGQRAGKAALYAVAFLTQPITTAVTMKVTIAKRRGGSRMIFEVPKIAAGAGSLTYLGVKLKKRFARNGRTVNVLTGTCPDGTLQSRFSALFADGATLSGDILQKCVPKPD